MLARTPELVGFCVVSSRPFSFILGGNQEPASDMSHPEQATCQDQWELLGSCLLRTKDSLEERQTASQPRGRSCQTLEE